MRNYTVTLRVKVTAESREQAESLAKWFWYKDWKLDREPQPIQLVCAAPIVEEVFNE